MSTLLLVSALAAVAIGSAIDGYEATAISNIVPNSSDQLFTPLGSPDLLFPHDNARGCQDACRNTANCNAYVFSQAPTSCQLFQTNGYAYTIFPGDDYQWGIVGSGCTPQGTSEDGHLNAQYNDGTSAFCNYYPGLGFEVATVATIDQSSVTDVIITQDPPPVTAQGCREACYYTNNCNAYIFDASDDDDCFLYQTNGYNYSPTDPANASSAVEFGIIGSGCGEDGHLPAGYSDTSAPISCTFYPISDFVGTGGPGASPPLGPTAHHRQKRIRERRRANLLARADGIANE